MNPPPAETSPAEDAPGLRLLAGAAAVAAVLLVAALGDRVLLGALALVAGFAGVFLARPLLLPYLVFLLGLPIVVNEMPLNVGGINVYGADGIVVFLAAAAGSLLRRDAPLLRPGERRYAILLAILVLWGTVAFVYGLAVSGHEFRDAAGAWRRYCFYPLALLVPLLLRCRVSARALGGVLAAAAGLVILTGLYRLYAGTSYRPDQFVFRATGDPDPRLLSYTECGTLFLSLALAAALWRVGSGYRKGVAAALGLASAAFLLLSGYRLSVLMAVALVVGAHGLMAWARRERLSRQLLAPVAALGLIVVAGLLLEALMPEYAADVRRRLVERIAAFRFEDDPRYYSWLEALRTFSGNPLVGSGLGRQPLFLTRGSEGTFIPMEMSTHSQFLAILAEAGLPAFLALAGLHVAFYVRVIRRLRGLDPDRQLVLTGLVAGTLGIVAFSTVEPIDVSTLVALHLLMGLGLLVAREARAPDGAPAAPGPP